MVTMVTRRWPRAHINVNLALTISLSVIILAGLSAPAQAQSISSGTVAGTVVDQSGAVVPGATIELRNDLSRYQQTTVTDSTGSFRFTNVPFNPYVLTATLSGFKNGTQNLTVRSTIPDEVKLTMAVGGVSESVTVQAAQEVIENVPTAHSDADRSFWRTANRSRHRLQSRQIHRGF
jgi:hypothetical protein